MDELDDISLETLELIEEIMFYQFDEAYQRHRRQDRDIQETVVAYEEALEAATALREAKEEEENIDEEAVAAVVDTVFDDASP